MTKTFPLQIDIHYFTPAYWFKYNKISPPHQKNKKNKKNKYTFTAHSVQVRHLIKGN